MRDIELSDEEWVRLKRRLMTKGPEEAMSDYTPPICLKHGSEYVTYEKRGSEDL